MAEDLSGDAWQGQAPVRRWDHPSLVHAGGCENIAERGHRREFQARGRGQNRVGLSEYFRLR